MQEAGGPGNHEMQEPPAELTKKWRVMGNPAAYDPTQENTYLVVGFYRWKCVAWFVAVRFVKTHPMGEAWVQKRVEPPKARLVK